MDNSGSKSAEEVNLSQRLTAQRAAVLAARVEREQGSAAPGLAFPSLSTVFYLLPFRRFPRLRPYQLDWQKSLSNPRLQASLWDQQLVSWRTTAKGVPGEGFPSKLRIPGLRSAEWCHSVLCDPEPRVAEADARKGLVLCCSYSPDRTTQLSRLSGPASATAKPCANRAQS